MAEGTDFTIANLMDELHSIASKWDILGRKLGVEDYQLKNISADYPLGDDGVNMRRLTALLRKWFCNTPDGTWDDIVTTLRKMENSRLAKKIEDKYCTCVQPSDKVVTADSEEHHDGDIDGITKSEFQPSDKLKVATTDCKEHHDGHSDIDGKDGNDKISEQNPSMMELISFPGKSQSFNIAQQIGSHYYNVGIALLNDRTGAIMSGIREKCQGDPVKISSEVLSRWIQGQGMKDCSWQGLIGVLRKHGLNTLADDIDEVKRK